MKGSRSRVFISGRTSGDSEDWKPKVNKDPYYRTTDIFNSLFKKRIRLEAGALNQTDGKTITVNFGETRERVIASYQGKNSEEQHTYMLDCGHEYTGRKGKDQDILGTPVPCWECGAQQSYLGFEHEWQHILFKSDLLARTLFVEQYVKILAATAPHIDQRSLTEFLYLLINAFDDIRCNSLWEKTFPGSAQQIWERWERKIREHEDAINDSFILFVFAVNFNLPTKPDGQFATLRPIVEWGVRKVRYRGFKNMLVDLRCVVEQALKLLMAQSPPQQQPQQAPLQGQPNAKPDQSSNPQAGQQPGDGDQSGVDNGPPPPAGKDDSGSIGGAGVVGNGTTTKPAGAVAQDASAAMQKLIGNSVALDDNNIHPVATDDDIKNGSRAAASLVAQVLNAKTDIPDQLDQGQVTAMDDDMQIIIHTLQNTVSNKTKDQNLVEGALAKIVFIDVKKEDVKEDETEFTESENMAISQMRATFFRALGKIKAKREATGLVPDVPDLLAYRLDRRDPNIFEVDSANRGFNYRILIDMSGSMSRRFPIVCRGAGILEQALDFPFVVGDVWGFRGGGGIDSSDGEVWIYRYDKECRGFVGKSKKQTFGHNFKEYPVECGGTTPMHTAVRLSLTDLRKNVRSGMAKRLFMITDGAPFHSRTGGHSIPDAILKGLVAKEIKAARQFGVEVYVTVIGEDVISDVDCSLMFGAQKYWRKVSSNPSSEASLGKGLTKLVTDNFTRYLRSR